MLSQITDQSGISENVEEEEPNVTKLSGFGLAMQDAQLMDSRKEGIIIEDDFQMLAGAEVQPDYVPKHKPIETQPIGYPKPPEPKLKRILTEDDPHIYEETKAEFFKGEAEIHHD